MCMDIKIGLEILDLMISIKIKVIFILILTFYGKSLYSQNQVCFPLEENPNPNDPALSIFSKYVNVLDCINIYAEPNISDQKILHAASVAAELLDNDEDGIVDDPLIEESLSSLNTIMPIFQYEDGNSIDIFFDNLEDDGCTGAVLFRNEIDPSQPGHWGSDATVEEVLHTINACGHVEVYPGLYGLEPNSSYLSMAMDVARGGQYMSVPQTYPEDSWYHYDDWTCDYGCMAMEYLYWCIVTNMDIISDPQTCAGIANEWEPCTPELFESTDELMHHLITNPINKLPQLAPDGNYCAPTAFIQGRTDSNGFKLFSNSPNPFNSSTTISYNIKDSDNVNIVIYDYRGNQVKKLFNRFQTSGNYSIRWNGRDKNGLVLPSGIYFYKIKTSNFNQSKKMILVK